MSDINALFSVLKQSADPAVADVIAGLIKKGEDADLNRINVLDLSKRESLDEEKVISGFLHASRLGLFDLTWNVLCPGCSGVLDAHDTLKSLRNDDYHCGLCACGYEASVDEQVTGRRRDQAIEDAQKRGFAAAACANDADELARPDLQRDVRQHR